MKWRSLEESSPATDIRPLAEIFGERKALIAKYVPAEIQAVHARTIERLQTENVVQRALALGATAPSFELRDHNGKSVSSTQLLRDHAKIVIIFFRGRWCPFCVGQLEAMNLIAPEIQKEGAALVAISPQTVKQSFFTADQHKLRFPLLSDVGNQIARRFGLVYSVPDEQRLVYRSAFVNLPFANGDESWELPIPATYIIDRNGSILFASASPDYTERPEPADILRALESAKN